MLGVGVDLYTLAKGANNIYQLIDYLKVDTLGHGKKEQYSTHFR
jgi:hypothetical protein